MTVDPKSPLYDPSPLKDYMKALNVQYFYEEQGKDSVKYVVLPLLDNLL